MAIDYEKIGSNVYSGTADFGRIMVTFGTVIVLIVCVILLATGVYFVSKKPVFTQAVSATITRVNLDNTLTITIGDSITQITLKYMSSTLHTVGETITVYIKASDTAATATEASYTNDANDKTTGFIMILISIVVVVFALFQLYLTRRFKGYAALQGANAGMSLLFRR